MRIFLLTSILVLSISAIGASQVYDEAGNDLTSGGMIVPFGTPGTILNTIYHPYSSEVKGCAYMTDPVYGEVICTLADSTTISRIDPVTAMEYDTITVSGSYTYGLGFDAVHNEYITVDVVDDVIRVYNLLGTLVRTHDIGTLYGSGGPSGCAYDATHDVYWVNDWSNDNVCSYDRLTGNQITVHDTSAFCSRGKGLGYSPAHNELVVAGRDQGMIFLMDADTAVVSASFAASGSSSNESPGLAYDHSAMIWQLEYKSNIFNLTDSGHTGASLTADTDEIIATTGGAVNFTLNPGASYAGCNYLMLGSATGTAGIPLPGGGSLPLTYDIFTNIVVNFIGSPMFVDFLGAIPAGGSTTAKFDTLGSVPATAVGVKLYFAFAVQSKPWFASNHVEVEIK